MANEFLITDVVGKDAIEGVKELAKELNDLKDTYAEVAKEIAKHVKDPVLSFDELKKKAVEFDANSKKLADTQNALAEAQQKYRDLLKKVAEETEKNVKAILAEAQANQLNADAELKNAKAKTEQLRQEKMMNQQRQQTRLSIQEAIALSRQEVHSINEANEVNKKLRQTVKALTDEEDKDGKIRAQLNSAINVNTQYVRRNTDEITRQKMAVGAYKNEIKAAWVEIQNGNRSFRNLGIVASNTGRILRNEVTSGFRSVRDGVGDMVKSMVGAQAIISGIRKLFGFVSDGFRSIMSFQKANSQLAAILGTTVKNIRDLETDAKRLGAATKYTASEVTNLQVELAKLGFTRTEILQSTEAILRFAQATGAELPDAAALAGASLRMFGASTQETGRYVSAMAIATTKSALSFQKLQTMMPIVGPVAKAFNFTIEDTLALLGKLADAGFDASSAATATRNILLNLADGSGKLATSLGGPVKTLPELVEGLKKLKAEGVDLATTLELTDKRSVAAFNSFLTGVDSLIPLRDSVTDVKDEMDDMAHTMADNLGGSIAALSSAWEALMLTFSKSSGVAKSVVDFLAKGLRNAAKDLQTYEQQQEAYNNKMINQYANEKDMTELVEVHRVRMSRLYKEKLNEGMEEEQAAIEARKEYIEALQTTYDREESEYRTALGKRLKLENEYQSRSFWTKLTSWKRTGNVIKEEIENQIKVVGGLRGRMAVSESLIEGLQKADISWNPNGGANQQMTEKQKKKLEKQKREAEKQAKELLKIRQALQQAELDLMDEGLEKELAKIRLNWTKKIAAVKGNSEEEKQTREIYAELMMREVNEKELSWYQQKEKDYISLRLEAVKKGSDEEYDLKKRLLDIELEMEKDAALKKGEELLLIEEEYRVKLRELEESHASELNKKIEQRYSSQSIVATQAMSQELDELAKLYTQGNIEKEEYERRNAEIQQKYAIQQAQAAVDMAKEMLETAGLSDEDKLKIQEEIANAEIELSEKVRDAEVENAEKTAEAHKEKLEKLAKAIQMVADMFDKISGLTSAIFDAKIQKVEEEQEAEEEAAEKEQERIERLAETGAITEEEAEARKRAAEAKSAAKTEELEKKKAALQTRQAKFEKANSIMQAIIATSLAVLKALPNIPLSILVGAMGAIALATIIAQPIPKYAKGTKDHPGGLAVVGDAGRQEAVITDRGVFSTPSVPTIVDLPRHAVVLPDLKGILDYRDLKSDYATLDMRRKETAGGVTVNLSNDYGALERRMDENSKELSAIRRLMRRSMRDADYNKIYSRI